MPRTLRARGAAAILALALAGCGVQPSPGQPTSSAPSPSISAVAANAEAFAQAVADQVTAHWPHMAKVWPTYRYAEHALILVVQGPSETIGYAIDASGMRQLEQADFASITMPDVGGYDQLTFEGKPAIAMTIGSDELAKPEAATQLYRVATHELVHFYYQDEMPPDSADGRAQHSPLDATPRLYRQMIHHRLVEAYRDPAGREAALAKAKYWLQQWQREFPDEAAGIKTTDIAEGTARYTDNLGAFIAETTTPEQLRTEASARLVTGDFTPSAESESYLIGEVAALLLDEIKPDWKQDFYTSGQTLADLLLADSTAEEDSVDPAVETSVKASVANLNEELTGEIKDVTAARSDTSIPYLKIDDTDTDGSYGSTGSYVVDDEEVTTGFNKTFTVGGKNLTLSNLAVGHEFTDDGRSFLLVPLTMTHEVTDGVLTISDERVTADGIKVTASKEGGRTVYAVMAS